MLLFKKIKIPNFIQIQQELIEFTSPNVNLNLRFWDIPISLIKINVPTLYDFLMERKKISVRLCRFYLMPPFQTLGPHIDGMTRNKSPIGLNLPIIGYEGTAMNWYSCESDNLKDGPYGFNNIAASIVMNSKKLEHIGSTIIDEPTFVRTDVVHEVINNKATPRLVLSIRFFYTANSGQNFEDVLDLSEL